MAPYDDTDPNSPRRLYERFRESLGSNNSTYFDEGDLVDIFDYAGDVGDEYARLEALLCGARLYPDSELLADRRALYYLDRDDSGYSTRAFLEDYAPHSPIADIVRLESEPPESEAAAVKALEYFLEQYDRLADEEVIRFVQLAVNIGQYKWLAANLDKVRAKTDFMPALLFEIMSEADTQEDFDTMTAVAAELTELEPFNVINWIGLLRGHARAYQLDMEAAVKADLPEELAKPEHRSEAVAAFDYAKALAYDSGGPEVVTLCETVFAFAPYLRDEAVELLEMSLEKNKSEFSYADILAGLHLQQGAHAKAVKVFRDFLANNPDSFAALRRLLALSSAHTNRQAVAEYFRAVPLEKLDVYDETIDQLHLQGAAASLDDFLSLYSTLFDLTTEQKGMWIEALYSLGNYYGVMDMLHNFDNMDELAAQPLRGCSFAVAAVGSYMKTGNGNKAKDFISRTRPGFEALLESSPLPVRMSVASTLRFFDAVYRHPAEDVFFWDYFDPFHLAKH